MGDSYSVDTAVLRGVAGSLGRQASGTQALVDTASTSDVSFGAWGLLGHEVGLDARYDRVRGEADRSLARIHDFLQWSAETLGRTASAYDEQEQAAAARFRAIGGADS